MSPTPPPYDPLEWVKKPLAERGRLVCEAWALQGYGAPLGVYAVYALKVALYVVAWVFFCSRSRTLGGWSTLSSWWLEPLAFQKAVVWSMLFEGLGLGCGSGPLTGRYLPPVGGFLYFLRPGTTKLALFPRLPLLGGIRRSWFDVASYAALVVALLATLLADTLEPAWIWSIVILTAVLGVADRTLFLALRSEHYWTTLVCFAVTPHWIAGAKCVQIALWFWAGVSKLNHHFPAVVCVMVSNSPVLRWSWLRRRMYRSFPGDLRPSVLAERMAHAGTVLELSVGLVLLFASGGAPLVFGMALMLLLHGFITSNVPMGVPIEWNVMVVYGAVALFWAHPEVSALDVGSLPLASFLIAMLIAVPLLGNFFPHRISFLLAMRFYAGNWASSVWLLRGDSYKKLARLTTSAPWIYDQLGKLYDRATSIGMVGRVLAFRLMHLHGRALPILIPKAVDRLEDYEYLDGEIVAGLVLGWNFGDGHLHSEQLLAAVQAQCGFEPGELRCIFLEGQPLGRATLDYRIYDAQQGCLERGRIDVPELRTRQPWMSRVEAT
ncbi:MAG TPA: DUF3556 domain-containing protein [Polyangiales bacterium]|nr:DUF3556 domain-containing protein [Polyangiales bacterium]